MDGLEAAETENTVETEVKEQSAEEDAQTEVDGNKQLTPVLQRSVSEESASSTASVGVEAKTSEQLCAFCYCGERSSLGQGDLKQFSPTPGFIIPWKNRPLNKSEANESTDGACERPPRQNSVPRKQRGQKRERSRQSIPSCTNVSTQTPSEDQVVKFWDELSLVGLPDDIDVQALFEPTGHCWAHHRCAEWSLGVCQTEEQLLVNVDKAVVSGSTERCAYCKHLGATIKCCEEICTLMYHYPCAAGAGTFQDFSNFSLLCPDHIDQAPERSKEEANCAVCDSPGDLLDQFFCTTCGQHYHGMCLDIQVTPLKRAGWQCPDCKVCQNCKHSGEDNKMLVCDTCDKGYHTFCLQPVMDSVPTNGWKCKNCRVCAECGTRTSCQWHHNCLVCDSCYQQQDNLPCPFCEKLCHPDFQKDMLHCHMCKRWIHIECDKPPGNELDSQLKDYMCPLCKQGEGDQTQPCDVMDTCELVPESGSMTACTNEMEIEGGAEDVAFQEQAITDDGPDQESTAACVTHVIDISQDEKTVELEKGVPDQVDIAEMETSPKRTPTPAPDDSQSEQMMEVTESAQAVTQQESDAQVEEKQLLQQDAEMSGISTEESQPPPSAPEAITTAPETLEPVNKEETAFKVVEQLETIRVQDDVEKGETCESSETPAVHLEVETAPANENCAKNSSPLAGKPIKSPAETCSSFSSSIGISKTSVSSSPAVSLDLHTVHDVMHSQTPALISSAGCALPATYVSVTPKIGMGKPAITKRKFSPGRPRSRQLQLCCSDLRTQEYDGEVGLPVYFKGAWSTNNTVSPPSWSPDISEGRDIFKSRQLPGSAIWSIKVGRGSGFPGKRRPRGAGLSGRGGRGRSKLKNGIGAVVIPGVTTMDISSNKEEEENSMHNTVVLFSNSDKFTLHQDMCVVCGSFGQGAEGRLLACSQCGQCYHPYCVSIKITKVVLSKGWRCLECTVCEACGKATDPGRLLLCDDCDISYHTYCLDPPLQTVPKGGWKCKWCVWCRRCGATSPGLRCEWQNNYTQCAPCASLSTCPICYRNYREEELIIQCRQCDRWIHAICQSLDTEEEVERIADMGFDCTICRPYMPATNVPSLDGCDSSVGVQMVSKSKELDPPKTYTQDGVCLTELGMSQLQSLTVTVPRRKRTKPKLKLKIINQNSVAVLQTPPDIQSEHSRDGEMDDSRGDLMDCDGKSDSSPERETVDDDAKVTEGADGIKKRKRKPYRPGIGGFMVRQRSRTGQGKTKRSLSRKDSSGSVSEQLPTRDEGWTEQLPDTPVDESTAVSENTEKTKKRYRKKKNKLEETFPAYLQEAFFGKDLLDTSRQSKLSLDNLSEESLPLPCKTNLATNFLDPSSDPLLSSASNPAQAKLGAQGTSEDPLADLSEVLNTDDDILGILSDDLVKSGDHSAGLDIGPISDDPSSLPQPSANQSSRPLSEEQLDGILSPELDKMVTDGAILGKLYKIPELGGKDVEDLFTAVLSPATTQPTPLPQPPPPPQLMPLHNQGESVFSRVPLMNGLIGPNPHLPHTPLAPAAGLGTFSPIAQPPYADARDKTSFNPMVNDPNSPWTPSAQPMEGEGDTMSNAQRSTLKWEKEEALGEMATVAPVLYTNINFPNLKEEFPDWATRVKQIAKLWRKASSQERAPYVQKARDNRAALRINKVQMSNDSMKRQQQQDSIDPSSRIDSDLFKDPLKQRESEHEQEWKFRQQMRQKNQQRPGADGNYNASANSPMSSQGQQFSKASQVPGPAPTTGVTDTQNTLNMSQADTEKLRQRQKLREIILQQQQQKKNAVRQEKALQDPAAPPHAAPLQHWQQENINQIFNRPPPPYPGNIRASIAPPGGPRFTVFTKDHRGPFPADGQFNRPQFPGDMAVMGMRPHGLRFGFPGGGHGPPPGQERFLGSQQQMQRPGVPPQLRRSLSIDMPRPLNNPQMNNPAGLSQHFPPQGIQVQQHNILGQAFIELRHRAPDGRPRLPFNPSAPGVIETAAQNQRHTGFIPRPDFQVPRHNEPVRRTPQGITNQLQMPANMEHLPQPHQDQISSNHPSALVMRSLSHAPVGNAFSGTPLPSSTSREAASNLQIPNQPTDGLEEKLDPDDPAVKDLDVKDLDGVEVKDLVDEDLENLNLDTEDGKGDELDTLDNLETNDPHLDDLLRSGEFDIIAYTDPELDLGDKKSMFNEELDLSVPIDDKLDIQGKTEEPKQKEQGDRPAVPADARSPQKKSTEGEIKTEVLSPNSLDEKKNENEKSDGNAESAGTQMAAAETELKDGEKGPAQPCKPELPEKTTATSQEKPVSSPDVVQGPAQLPAQSVISSCSISESTPVLSSLLANESSDNAADIRTISSPPQALPATPMNPVSGIPQTLMSPPGQVLENTLNSNMAVVPRINHSFSQGSAVNPGFIQGQSTNHNFGTGQPTNQAVTVTNRPGPSSLPGPQQIMLPQPLSQQPNRERPLLLEEQPLLLQDLLDQERQEQQQQRQMQAMIRQRSEPFFPNIDFDAITDPIMKAKMVALKGINKVMAQSNMGMPPMVMNRFPFVGQPMPGTQTSEGQNLIQQPITQDGNLTPQISRPNPPNFGPGFVNDSQRKQYEEWLQETQQLLQIQQKYLEDQIGAHRKSKKALSAKQRTAKKAGREFPEEDAEQLKQVTEQQSMVQKQLEQIRKQQKEHAELIEEYRIKQQQQCGMAPHAVMPGVQAQPPIVPGGTPPAMNQQNFPMVPHQQHTVVIPGQSNPARMPSLPSWQPGTAPPSHIPISASRMQPPMTQLPINPGTPTPVSGPSANAQSGPPPRVEFDDNNPFSESFQERERKERLREQQERQRIQLMQEVDRQRALQQRMEMEQHGMMGSELNNRTSLSQIPFFNSDLSCDFMQTPRPLQQSPQHQQQQMGQILQQGPVNSPPAATFMQSNERRPVGPAPFGPDPPSVAGGAPNFHSVKQAHGSISGTSFTQNQVRPPFAPGLPTAPSAAGSGPPCSQDTSMPHTTNFPGSSQSLIQLYSDIIPEEKGKKKRTRKKKKDEDAESVKAPSTPHSDITAPPTPTVSESTSTPTVSTPSELSRHQDEPESVEPTGPSTTNASESQSAELECMLPKSSLLQKQSSINPETDRGKTDAPASIQEIKLETAEADQCSGQAEPKAENQSGIKVEEDKSTPQPAASAQGSAQPSSTPPAKGESGNELLKHLLKNKKSGSLVNQKSESSCRPEEESAGDSKLVEKQNPAEATQTVGSQMQGGFGCGNSQVQRPEVGPETKKPRNKRTQRTGEKATPRSKKRKKEEEEKQAIYPNMDTFIQLKQQLSLLPLMEPIIGVSFAHFLPYGSGQINGGNRLVGSFGSATLDGVSDYYSQLIYKLVNGFATTEELAGKAGMLGGHDVTKALGPKQFQLPFRPQDDLLARAMAQGPKTVDVPASLPTPPHNNQEELRVQDHCDDRDTPDSFVPSSSPESVVGMEISRYPDLSLVKEETPEPVPSPIIPILPSSTGKGSEAKRNYIKSEPSSGTLPGSGFFGSQLGPSQNGPKSGLISVAITLHPTAAENISSVVAAFSNLLHVRIPNSYEVSSAPDIPSSMGVMNSHRANPSMEYRQHLLLHGPQAGPMGPARLVGSYGLKQPNMPFPPNSNGIAGYKDHSQNMAEGSVLRPQWCSHCKVVVLGSGVRKSFKDLPFLKQDPQESSDKLKDIVFCSNNCFVLYSAAAQAKKSESKELIPTLPQSPMKEMQPKAFHQYSNNISTLDVHCLPQFQEKASPPSSPPITFPPAFEAAKVEAKPDELKVTVKLKPRLKAIHSGLDDCRPPNKKWKGMKWKKWSIQIVIPKGSFKPPGDEEIDEFLKKLGTTLKPDPVPKDYRKCCFCHEEGDGLTDGPARLLNLDLDLWVHLNCALWSTEVYETQAGALINVELALRRGLQMKCMFCHKMGATSGCHRLRCTNIYHFTCAIKAQCMFFKDKTMLCPMHKPKGAHEQELSYFAVFRRVYVQRDEVRQIASIVQRGERDHTFRVGSLIFHTIGQLLPQQMQAFHSSKALFPIGYEASRLYWSMRYANRRCRYLCSIEEKDGLPLFVIKVIEQGHEDLVLSDTTPKGVWDKILEPVASVRKESEMLQLFPGYLKGEDLFGLTASAVARIAESLPGVEACENYTFRYGRNPLMELPLAINPTGCARAEPKMSTHVKRFVLRPHTLNSTSTSKSFQSTVTGELNAPYSKQFVHSKSSQYRKMKTEWKSNVYLARSRIQGLGLYAARDIEKHTMVIEYIGTIIRNEVANRKEKLYESQNRGVYMFRIDNDHVIDATLTGGPARYINHSCAPNCVAEVVTFERGHKIIISSSRRIQKGEELCYDYKFDFEDDQHKIPCHCGAVNCRKWMN
ncbi:histone-lysine N-methyltransferase 2D isoform B [Alligator mississippiensis]|uniref:Histone-lysine N-methyltransferase 2C n=1 Tax=Alligator mississippiensis TaxID=8496 RepID=A0A151PDV6_ALLMI|nr:histone-lysine N-methyltransferase 2D isoform B [Alligator mississippiensis]